MADQTTRAAEGLDRRAFTVSEVARMLEAGILDWDDRFELIGGELVPMAAQLMPHAALSARLARHFARALDDAFEILTGGTIQLGDDALFEPDVCILPRLADTKRREFIKASGMFLAIEVADTTLRKDLGPKALRYAQGGVPELWVVDVNARITHVHRDPKQEGYGAITRVSFEDALSPAALTAPPICIADIER